MNRWIRTFVWIAVGMLTVLAGQPYAQQEGKTQQKVATVSQETIESQWSEFHLLKVQIERFLRQDREDIDKLRSNIGRRKKLLDERQAEGEIDQDFYEKLSRALEIEMRRVDIYTEVRATIVQNKVDQQLEKASKIVEGVVKDVAEEEGYDLVINDEKLLGVDNDLDISQEVLKVLESNHYGLVGL